jgi:hypothetical protein
MQNQNQCVFIRGFRISIRESIFAAAFRGRLAISSVSESSSQGIFGLNRGSPFSPLTGGIRTWFGGGAKSSTASSLRQQAYAPPAVEQSVAQRINFDAVLDPILTTSEVVLACETVMHPLTLLSDVSSFPNYPKVSTG